MTTPANEHDCAGCGALARVWVPVGLANPEPCCRACAARVASEPAFRESLAAAHSEPVEDVLPPLRRLLTYAERGRRAGAMRRRCNGCPMVTTPPALALHQRATGHSGWEAVR